MRLRRRRTGAAVRPLRRDGVACPPERADRSGPRRAGEGRRPVPGITVLVACLVATAACTGAPPPARHAAIRAHGAPSTAQSLAVAEDIGAQNALPGDPRWRVIHP